MSANIRFRILLLTSFLILGLGGAHVLRANSSLAPTNHNPSGWKINSRYSGQKISMVSASDGWIVLYAGQTAYLYHWDGATWTSSESITHTQEFIVRGDIFMNSSTDGWIVLGGPLSGSSNLAESSIYRWNGSVWSHFATVTDLNAVSLSALDMNSTIDGWATAAFNFGSLFYRWNGSSWQKFSSVWLPNDAGNDIDMVSPNDGWAVGFLGDIYRWNGGSWNEVASPVTTSLNSVEMVSADDGWAVGAEGNILRWDGSTWTQVSSPVTVTLNSLSMVSTSDGWAVGGGWNGHDFDPGAILHWDGNTWTEVDSPISSILYDVAMISAIDGWIVGGATLHYEPETLTINYKTGQPGSFFNVAGSYFPPDSSATIMVNGRTMTTTFPTNPSGVFTFTLSTNQADPGLYLVTVNVNPSAVTRFTLNPTDPLRSREGNWTVLDVPSGIALTESVYLPLIME